MEGCVIGLDVGTTAVKAVLMSDTRLLDEVSVPHDLRSPRPGWAEEDAGVWWDNACAALRALAQRNTEAVRGLRAIGCSGMVPALVLLDDVGEVLRATIQQNDARAGDELAEVSAALPQEELYARTGGRSCLQHIAPRLLWVRRHEPEVWARTRTVLGSYDYIAYRLTGVRALEHNWAAESGCWDIRARRWLPEYMTPFGLTEELFPPVHVCTDVLGALLPEVADVLGLPRGVAVTAGSADHIASALSAGMTGPGDALIKFGGGGDVLFCTDRVVTDPRLFFDYADVPGLYVLNGCMAASGSVVKWYAHDLLGGGSVEHFAQLDAEAAAVPPGSDGLVVLPYFLGEKTPIFDPDARGVFFGLTLSHTRGHLFRAILEAVVYGFRHHLDVMAEAGLVPARVFATNGGSRSSFWCQIAADVLGREILSCPNHPGSALGVGFAAGMAVGLFERWTDVARFPREKRYTPNPAATAVYERSYALYRALYPMCRPGFEIIRENERTERQR